MAVKRRKSRTPSGPQGKLVADPQNRTPADALRREAAAGLAWKLKLLVAASVVAAIVVIGLSLQFLTGASIIARFKVDRGNRAEAAAFVGSETCAGCHRAEAELWRGSQHRLAMDHATDKSVLGDFNDATFEYYGVRSRFFRQDGKFLVETDGPD